jgi:hypothetical protein
VTSTDRLHDRLLPVEGEEPARWRAPTTVRRRGADRFDSVKLPGVGRKTANVVAQWVDLPGLPVDTHVGRLARRLKFTSETDP